MIFSLNHEGTIYNFSRGRDGIGYWFCLRGRVPGMFGSCNSGLIVSSNLSQQLTKIAVEKGIGTNADFCKTLQSRPSSASASVIKEKGNSKPRSGKSRFSINPFMSETANRSSVKVSAGDDDQELDVSLEEANLDEEDESDGYVEMAEREIETLFDGEYGYEEHDYTTEDLAEDDFETSEDGVED